MVNSVILNKSQALPGENADTLLRGIFRLGTFVSAVILSLQLIAT